MMNHLAERIIDMSKAKYVYVVKDTDKTKLWRRYFTSFKKAKQFAESYLSASGYREHVRHEGDKYLAFVTANKGPEWRMYFINREWLG
jgi:hypothetical protein